MKIRTTKNFININYCNLTIVMVSAIFVSKIRFKQFLAGEIVNVNAKIHFSSEI